jgi:two-component system sensor histidine kinase UhpB
MEHKSPATLANSLSRMFLLSLLVVVAIGMSFMAHTERQSIIRQMNQRAALAMEIINVGLVGHELNKASAKNQLLTQWKISLNQLASHHHLAIHISDGNDQQILYFPNQKNITNANQNDSDWVGRMFSVKSQTIKKTFQQGSSPAIKVMIDASPMVDVALIKQRIFTFLILMTLLATLVYAAIKIMTARFLKELNVINNGINYVEKGHYRMQLPEFYFSEIAHISDSYNQAVDQLEKARRENQTLAERFLWLQEEERQFLAQELHDELGQSISAIKVMCVTMQKTEQQASQQSGQKSKESALAFRFKSITDICDHLYTVVQDLMKRLRPTILDELGLKAALEEVVNTWRQRYAELEISLYCEESVEKFDDNININVYRIVQESLTNTVKHADARHINISLREYHNSSRPWVANTYYQLDIVDDGKGFNATDKRFGFGLVGMRERVKSMGGTLEIRSSCGAGTTISVQIPAKT